MNVLQKITPVTRSFLMKINFEKQSYNKQVLNYSYNIFCRMNSSSKSTLNHEEYLVTIGDVKKLIKKPQKPAFVPIHQLPGEPSPAILSDLRWMLQKDLLGQDMFLIGRPGPWKRRLALMYSQLIQREIEFVSLSRDTTEADLKQRREIINGSAVYINQSAVRAAIDGRILILEGVEKAERNVLPILNNLLENREMHLEDGRFLVAPQFYDNLLSEHGCDYLSQSNFVRVHDDFRVIALGLPVPKYNGNSLDPPLRSRFQARVVNPPTYQDMKNMLVSKYPKADKEKFEKLLSCGYALVAEESKSLQLKDFPIDHLEIAANLLSLDPRIELTDLFSILYPFEVLTTDDGCHAIRNLLKRFQINYPENTSRVKNSWFGFSDQRKDSLKVNEIRKLESRSCAVHLSNGSILEAKTGDRMDQLEKCESSFEKYVSIPYHDHQLVNFLRTHAADSDFCVIGPTGCGKSVLVQRFASLLGYDVDPITLYQDMTARDLIQRRETLPNGDTIWRNSPLVDAALTGRLVLLDGIHRVHSSTLSFLFRLICDRELQLHNGQRLMHHDKFDHLESEFGSEYLKQEGVLRIAPEFRIIAIGLAPEGVTSWLNSELLSFFPVHHLRSLHSEEESHLIEAVIGTKLDDRMHKVLKVVHTLRSSHDATLVSAANSLSTRQLLRIAKKMVQFPATSDQLYESIEQACLAKFLPPLTRQSLEKVLSENGIKSWSKTADKALSKLECKINDDTVTVGDSIFTRFPTDKNHIAKIPNVLFYDSPQHIQALEQLLQDYDIGQHLLLVGNQGVGKNKLTDRLLQLLNRPREYIQLHRDTTVQSLTMQPTIEKGSIKYEDSPLVKAVQSGHVLVVDEADKAPTHVTCILKTLVESGEMLLSDGRRITRCHNTSDPHVIPLHPQFRMILLANRPGFPFLGNNLFAVLGDLFSCHVIDNPRPDSEIQLLSKYAPNVDQTTIKKIVSAFGDLRTLADKGVVSYPFSTREAVSIVKHLQAFPLDGVSEAAANVFDFDRYSEDMKEVLGRVFDRHHISIRLDVSSGTGGIAERNLRLTIERKNKDLDVSGPKHGKIDEKNTPHVGGNTWAGGTGGRDTAGLGGKGGPYRLDAGHDVHQLSNEEKQNVPEHIKKAAREMNRQAFERKLKEIEMSEYDAKVYEEFSQPVLNQVQTLRVILSNLESRSNERQWIRHQTSGELDDTKLVEGITGEKGVYRRRADIQSEPGTPLVKPKRVLLVVDVSGSMYRFNGHDGRLYREMEAVIMMMEAVQGHEKKIQLEIVGHSGESDDLTFLSKDTAVTNEKQRIQILKTMHAHAQFCMAGDHTLQAMRKAVKRMEKDATNYDENVVIVLSDANLSRYGIPPERLAQVLISSKVVNAFVVFIGSLGNQATVLKEALPAGKGFVCMNLQDLPLIIGQVFASSLLKSPE